MAGKGNLDELKLRHLSMLTKGLPEADRPTEADFRDVLACGVQLCKVRGATKAKLRFLVAQSIFSSSKALKPESRPYLVEIDQALGHGIPAQQLLGETRWFIRNTVEHHQYERLLAEASRMTDANTEDLRETYPDMQMLQRFVANLTTAQFTQATQNYAPGNTVACFVDGKKVQAKICGLFLTEGRLVIIPKGCRTKRLVGIDSIVRPQGLTPPPPPSPTRSAGSSPPHTPWAVRG